MAFISYLSPYTFQTRPRKRRKHSQNSLVLMMIKYLQIVRFECEVLFYRCLKKHSNISLTTFYTTGRIALEAFELFFKISFVFVSCASRRSSYFTYHRSRRHRIPLEPECDKRRCDEDNAGYEEGREVERSIPCKDKNHFQAAVVA